MSNAFILLNVLALLAAAGPSTGSDPSSQPASAATAPSTQPVTPVPPASPLVMWVASLGLCVLVAYVVYRWARPGKLKLSPVPRRANGIQLAHVLLLFGLNLLIVAALYALLPRLWGADEARVRILTSFGSQMLWLPVILLAARATFPKGLVRGMGLSIRHWFIDGLRGGVAYLAVFPVCWLLAWVAMQFPGGVEHPMLTASRDVGLGWKVLSLFSVVVLAPLAEEVFFRGLLQSMLRNYWTSPWPAVVLTSVLFAASHRDWHWMPALTVLGLVLGYNYERTGRLMAPILIHALFNGVSMASLFLYGY